VLPKHYLHLSPNGKAAFSGDTGRSQFLIMLIIGDWICVKRCITVVWRVATVRKADAPSTAPGAVCVPPLPAYGVGTPLACTLQSSTSHLCVSRRCQPRIPYTVALLASLVTVRYRCCYRSLRITVPYPATKSKERGWIHPAPHSGDLDSLHADHAEQRGHGANRTPNAGQRALLRVCTCDCTTLPTYVGCTNVGR